MSDDFHRPTLTFPSGPYNASQVRLYGIAPKEDDTGIVFPNNPLKLESRFGNLSVTVSVTTGSDKEDEAQNKEAQKLIKVARGDTDKSDAQVFSDLVKETPEINGEVKLAYYTQVTLEMKQKCNITISATITRKQAITVNSMFTCGIIVGYAYEGHTYDLPKPKIMIIPTIPEKEIPEDDSGYKQKESSGYAVWLVDKLDECLEFEMNQGFVEQIILDANLPGKRAPNMYAGRMMMGHRGGRLTE
jgi:hypothetical protein